MFFFEENYARIRSLFKKKPAPEMVAQTSSSDDVTWRDFLVLCNGQFSSKLHENPFIVGAAQKAFLDKVIEEGLSLQEACASLTKGETPQKIVNEIAAEFVNKQDGITSYLQQMIADQKQMIADQKRMIAYVESKERMAENKKISMVAGWKTGFAIYVFGCLTSSFWGVVLEKPTEEFRNWYKGLGSEKKSEIAIPPKLDPDTLVRPWADIALSGSDKARNLCHRKTKAPVQLAVDQLGRPRDPKTGKTGMELLESGRTIVLPNTSLPLRLEGTRSIGRRGQPAQRL